jgi:hypothetical protein
MNLQTYQLPIVEKTHLSERATLLKPFIKRIDGDRAKKKLRPYGAAHIAQCMSFIKTEELHFFYQKLDAAKSFGGLWHHYCKPKT